MAFKPGDIVMLKSGGPTMPVENARPDQEGVPHVWTVWFDGTKKMDGYFPEAAVTVADFLSGVTTPSPTKDRNR